MASDGMESLFKDKLDPNAEEVNDHKELEEEVLKNLIGQRVTAIVSDRSVNSSGTHQFELIIKLDNNMAYIVRLMGQFTNGGDGIAYLGEDDIHFISGVVPRRV